MRAHAWTRTHDDTFQWQLPWGILAPTLENERNIQQAIGTVAQLSQHLLMREKWYQGFQRGNDGMKLDGKEQSGKEITWRNERKWKLLQLGIWLRAVLKMLHSCQARSPSSSSPDQISNTTSSSSYFIIKCYALLLHCCSYYTAVTSLFSGALPSFSIITGFLQCIRNVADLPLSQFNRLSSPKRLLCKACALDLYCCVNNNH